MIYLVGFILIGVICIILSYYFFSNRVTKLFVDSIALKIEDVTQDGEIKQVQINNNKKTVFASSDLLSILGFENSKTYLFLFLNNTEYRPGGGFIGSYAVINFDKGIPNIITFDGTENLDNNAPKNRKVIPPLEMSKYLKIDNWEFRDSNWSPDFAESAKLSLQFYTEEGGVEADKIDALVAITPTVLEEIMKITGDITVDGLTFTGYNVVEKLEYEVEYGYRDRNISVQNRKKIMENFMKEILKKVSFQTIFSSDSVIEVMRRMIDEKHIMAYSDEEKISNTINNFGMSGKVNLAGDRDYLLWVDANLSALKTDHALRRELNYSLEKKNSLYTAKAEMMYNHIGVKDWRTTRYQSYTRVYVPIGSKLVQVRMESSQGAETILKQIDIGVALDKAWIGFMVRVNPQEKVSYIVSYLLPPMIDDMINNGQYRLTTQKQLGSVNTDIKLNLDFDRKIVGAYPREQEEYWGDSNYRFNNLFATDQSFEIGF